MWKSMLRQSIWDMMEASPIGRFRPIPVQGTIPDFAHSSFAVHRLTSLQEFEDANHIKVDMIDTQFYLRCLVMKLRRNLIATKRDHDDSFFAVLKSEDIPFHYSIEDGCSRLGFSEMAKPCPLFQPIRADLAVVNSLAVDPRTGARVSLGEGQGGMGSDLEYGIYQEIGVIDERTTLVTLVDPDQVVEFGVQKMDCFDIPVDIIITPYETHRVDDRLPRPKGIFWELLEQSHYLDIPCLQTLKSKFEQEANSSEVEIRS